MSSLLSDMASETWLCPASRWPHASSAARVTGGQRRSIILVEFLALLDGDYLSRDGAGSPGCFRSSTRPRAEYFFFTLPFSIRCELLGPSDIPRVNTRMSVPLLGSRMAVSPPGDALVSCLGRGIKRSSDTFAIPRAGLSRLQDADFISSTRVLPGRLR